MKKKKPEKKSLLPILKANVQGIILGVIFHEIGFQEGVPEAYIYKIKILKNE